MLEVRPPPAPGLPQLPRSPFLHAVLITPADRTGACRFLPCPRGLPRLTGGSASTTSLSRPPQASLALRPARLLARPKADFCPEASTWPVTRPSRSVATTSYRQLHGLDPPSIGDLRRCGARRVEEGRWTGTYWQPAVSLPRSSNRTCPARASGFPTGFTATPTKVF